MSLYQLDYNHFSKNGDQLIINMDGATLVMYTAENCVYCKQFENEFKMLPNSVNTVNFAICSLDGPNRQIAQMSKGTTSPIANVPCFIFYSNGIPTALYKGKRTRNDIIAFLQEMMKNHQGSFARPPRPQQPPSQQQMPQPPPQQQEKPKYIVNPNSGVKEYETSYGLPHNAVNEAEFLAYESAYKQIN